MTDGLRSYDASQQVQLVDDSVHDVRRSIPTGVGGIDSLLRRGGLLPGSFTLFGGRTGTRKTTTVLNMMVSMAQANIPVAFVGLDEPPWMYVNKVMSLWSHKTQDWLEENWDNDAGKAVRDGYKDFARGRLHIMSGRRPTPDHISGQVEMVSMDGQTPAVVFLDYLSLMVRGRDFGWSENDRVPRLAEELAVWSTESGIALVMLHQLSRNDEYGGTNSRNQGHLPVTLSQLKYGGEEPADMVLGTYRPSMHPIANMSMSMARQVLGDRFDEEDYWALVSMAKRFSQSTVLQLLKNRPGVHREEHGVEMYSPNETLFMEERAARDPYGDEEVQDAGRANLRA
jgi:replicative DNA helicase